MADVALPAAAGATGAAHEAPAVPDFQIVPLRGLPIVAAVFIALIAAIAANKLWALEFFHVAFGALWTSIDLFLGLVLGPILGRLSIPARIEMTTRADAEGPAHHAHARDRDARRGLAARPLLGTVNSDYRLHGWIVASYIVVGVMAVIALGLLEPANVAVLFELKKRRPDPVVIQRLMKRFIYTAGVIGAMQVATLVIMTKVATG